MNEERELTKEEKEVIARLEDVMRQANELEEKHPGIMFGNTPDENKSSQNEESS